MKKIAHTFFVLTGALALGAGACSSSSPGTTTGGGGAGGSTTSNPFPGGKALIPTSTGYVDDTANTGVIGPWYTYSDAAGPAAGPADTDFAGSSCKKGGFAMTACSVVMPTPGQPVPPDTTTGAMCATGTGAVVMAGSTGTADYSDLWGAGLALDFNNKGGDAGAKGTFDLSKYTGIGFTFSGTNIPVNHMRVNFPFVGENNGSDSPYWQGGTQEYSSLANNQTITIKWADVKGPKYLTEQTPPTTPPAFDASKVQSIQFQVFTNAATATPFSFCVNNLTLLTQ
jgi:hypothetical protein